MKTLSSFLKMSALVLAAAAFVSNAKADETLLSLTDGTTGNAGEGNYGELVLGVAFTPTENITVTELGAYAADFLTAGGKTSQDFTAVLYTFTPDDSTLGTGVVLDNATIIAGTGVDSNNVAFTTIAPRALTAGTEYFIGAIGGTPSDFGDVDGVQWGNGSGSFAANIGALTAPSDVTLDTSGFSSSSNTSAGAMSPTSVGLGAMQDFTLANVYFAGDLRYTPTVPEPSDFAYLAVGGLALAFVLRRKNAERKS